MMKPFFLLLVSCGPAFAGPIRIISPQVSEQVWASEECATSCASGDFLLSLESQGAKTLSANLRTQQDGVVLLDFSTNLALNLGEPPRFSVGPEVLSSGRFVTHQEGWATGEIEVPHIESDEVRLSLSLMGGAEAFVNLSLDEGLGLLQMEKNSPRDLSAPEWTTSCSGESCTARTPLGYGVSAVITSPCADKRALSIGISEPVYLSSPVRIVDESGPLLREIPYSACGPTGCQATALMSVAFLSALSEAEVSYQNMNNERIKVGPLMIPSSVMDDEFSSISCRSPKS